MALKERGSRVCVSRQGSGFSLRSSRYWGSEFGDLWDTVLCAALNLDIPS